MARSLAQRIPATHAVLGAAQLLRQGSSRSRGYTAIGRDHEASGALSGSVAAMSLARSSTRRPSSNATASRPSPSELRARTAASTGSRFRPAPVAGSHSRTVRSALPDGRTLLATGSTDQTMRLWDTEASTCLTRVRLTGVISDIAVVPGTTPCLRSLERRVSRWWSSPQRSERALPRLSVNGGRGTVCRCTKEHRLVALRALMKSIPVRPAAQRACPWRRRCSPRFTPAGDVAQPRIPPKAGQLGPGPLRETGLHVPIDVRSRFFATQARACWARSGRAYGLINFGRPIAAPETRLTRRFGSLRR